MDLMQNFIILKIGQSKITTAGNIWPKVVVLLNIGGYNVIVANNSFLSFFARKPWI